MAAAERSSLGTSRSVAGARSAASVSGRSRAARRAAMWPAASSRKRAKLGQALRSMTRISPSGVTMASPPHTSSSSASRGAARDRPQGAGIERVPLRGVLLRVEPLKPAGFGRGRRPSVAARRGDAVELDEVARHVALHAAPASDRGLGGGRARPRPSSASRREDARRPSRVLCSAACLTQHAAKRRDASVPRGTGAAPSSNRLSGTGTPASSRRRSDLSRCVFAIARAALMTHTPRRSQRASTSSAAGPSHIANTSGGRFAASGSRSPGARYSTENPNCSRRAPVASRIAASSNSRDGECSGSR